MTLTIAPSYTDNVSVLALQTLALGANVRAVLDWRTKRGGWLFACLGRGGTTALTNPVYFIVRRLVNGTSIIHPGALSILAGASQAATRPTCAGTGNAAGQNLLDLSSTTNFLAGGYIFIDGTGGTTNSEWARISAVLTSTRLQLDSPLQYAHNNTSDHATNWADVYAPVWADGGAEIEVIFDYGLSTTGDTATIRALAQTYDSDSVT